MSLVRWSPFAELEAMQGEVNRLFSRSGDRTGLLDRRGTDSHWILPMDVSETADMLKLKSALPGVNSDDLKIDLNDNMLTVSAERRNEEAVDEGGYHWIEQQYGTFSRTITLPRYADTENIKADFNNGMLEIVIPKKENARSRQIDFRHNGRTPKSFDSGVTKKDVKKVDDTVD